MYGYIQVFKWRFLLSDATHRLKAGTYNFNIVNSLNHLEFIPPMLFSDISVWALTIMQGPSQ